MGNLETRIMFLIVLLGALWLLLSETGRSYIANFAAVISGNTVIPTAGSKSKTLPPTKTRPGTAPAKSKRHKGLLPAQNSLYVPPATGKGYRGLVPTHKFLGGLYPAP